MSNAPLERFTLDDADALAALSAAVSWRDSPADWRTVLTLGHVAGLRSRGAPVAVAARFEFGGLWSIGKVIVHPSHQGRGHARRILEHLLAERSPDTRVALVATSQGEPVYRRLGFRRVGSIHKLVGAFTVEARDGGLTPLDARNLDAALALDREVFGADRGALLSRRVQSSTRAVALGGPSGIAGYGIAIEQGGHVVIGPVLAPGADDALSLVRALLPRDARPRRVDVPAAHERFIEALVSMGFRDVEARPVMSLGGAALPGDVTRRFALAAQAFG